MKKNKLKIKKGDLITIYFLNIIGDSIIKPKIIKGHCLQIKKNKKMPTITLNINILKEAFIITFLLKSPLILKLNKL